MSRNGSLKYSVHHLRQLNIYKIEAQERNYYLKISKSLRAEYDNLRKLEHILNVPKVIDYSNADKKDYLLISELSGKNLVELVGELSHLEVIDILVKAIRGLHSVDVTKVFPESRATDTLLHGDMALPNIIISDQGRIGYIDFGQMSFGTPELDLVDAIWSLQRNIGPGYGKRFLQKYGPVTMTPKIEEALKFKYQASEEG